MASPSFPLPPGPLRSGPLRPGFVRPGLSGLDARAAARQRRPPVVQQMVRRRRMRRAIVGVVCAVAAAGGAVGAYATRPAIDQYRPFDDALYASLSVPGEPVSQRYASFTELAQASSIVAAARAVDVVHVATTEANGTTYEHYGVILEPQAVLAGSTAASDATLTVEFVRADGDPQALVDTWRTQLPERPALWFLRTSDDGAMTGRRLYQLTDPHGVVVAGLTHVYTPLASDDSTALSAQTRTLKSPSELSRTVNTGR